MKEANAKLRRSLPYVITFIKFSAGFTLLIVLALVTLHVASAGL